MAASHTRLQIDSENPQIRQGQAGDHCWQHSSPAKVGTRVLLHAGKDKCSSFRWKQREWKITSPCEEALFGLWRDKQLTSSLYQIELGTACGKLYRCSTLAVLDAGDSDILSGTVA